MSDDITLHGIPNCDSVRQARRWLEEHGVAHAFHDFRRHGLDAATVNGWVDALGGWDALVNRRGTTWRKLAEEARADLDRDRAVALMLAHPTIVKRPVLVRGALVLVGFDATKYTRSLSP